MRIALVAPLVAPIAPPFLGGAQVIVHDLAAGLAARGHAVSLYAADGSAAPGVGAMSLGIDATTLRAAWFNPTRLNAAGLPGDTNADTNADGVFFDQAHHFLRIALHIAEHAAEFDLVHAHAYDWPAFAFGALLPLPTLHTLHVSASSRAIRDVLRTLAAAPNTRLAAVSRACAASYASDPPIATVLYNGLDVAAIPFGAEPAAERYLLFAGRMSPEKGVSDALAIARAAGRRLILVGNRYDPAYFDTEVAPPLAEMAANRQAEYLGPVARERLWHLMADADAVLVPSHWEEPFGLAPCEAQAAGAPVVGYRVGALPEVVADGVTGWLVPRGDIAAAAAAV
ncbi:MAG TPA: glycosyltransferase, partial [Ktedonobacterales bacterium]|nr:glycosyltransferase [Ktedonobacterales bacterium]